MIRVVVIDDHEVVRKGIIAYLQTDDQIEVVGAESNGHDGVSLVKKVNTDVDLMDLNMENGTGIEATEDILADSSDCKIIILTSYYDDEQVFPALEAGAFSYLLKTSSAADIVDAIKKAMIGEKDRKSVV